MFTPKVAKPQTKATTHPTTKLAPQRWKLAQFGGHSEQEGDRPSPITQEATPEFPWDFSKIPMFQHEWLSTPRPSSQVAAVPLPGVIQAKLVVGPVNDPLELEADRIADQVMREPSPTATLLPLGEMSSSQRAQSLQSKCSRDTAFGKSSPGGAAKKAKQSQLSAAGSAETAYAPPIVKNVLRSSGQALDPIIRAFMEPRFGRDFSRVRVHADARAAESAQSMNALAYTVGQHIAFAAGSYAPSTANGVKLLAHELAHTIQQDEAGRIAGGRASDAETVRRRRIPDASELAATLPAGGTDLAAHEAGLVRLLHSAWSELSAANQMKVRTDAVTFGISAPTEAALFAALSAGTREQILKFADAIRAADPTVQLGDPALIDTGPRAGTADVANINKLVAGADKIFNAVAAGGRDADLSDVFGPSNVGKAKAKFAKARAAMHSLQTANKIVTDRSGYSREVGLGGLTDPTQIALAPEIIDNPTDADSTATLVHESMHAGNPEIPRITRGVTDLGYIGSKSFTEMKEADKLDNAADYEVIANRILTPTAPSAFPGKKFVPAGATVGGVTAPPLTQRQAAMREASETYRGAWTAGLNLHKLFVRVFEHPAEWNTLNLAREFSGAAAGTHFSDSLPFWSKVENMTIHKRPGISAAGGKPSNPVTAIDVAQSEGVVRKLAQGMFAMTNLTEPDVVNLETKATAAQAAEIATGPAGEAKVVVSLVRSEKVGEITGRVERDERAVDRLAKANRAPDFSDVLSPKSPSTFAD
jgi:Domain of unknown function (DUF4157)